MVVVVVVVVATVHDDVAVPVVRVGAVERRQLEDGVDAAVVAVAVVAAASAYAMAPPAAAVIVMMLMPGCGILALPEGRGRAERLALHGRRAGVLAVLTVPRGAYLDGATPARRGRLAAAPFPRKVSLVLPSERGREGRRRLFRLRVGIVVFRASVVGLVALALLFVGPLGNVTEAPAQLRVDVGQRRAEQVGGHGATVIGTSAGRRTLLAILDVPFPAAAAAADDGAVVAVAIAALRSSFGPSDVRQGRKALLPQVAAEGRVLLHLVLGQTGEGIQQTERRGRTAFFLLTIAIDHGINVGAAHAGMAAIVVVVGGARAVEGVG
mmetsp:Transcript_29852/g.55509  ORF Transcript_29852/g.55509 Transcript_29852/m.55509 type:complete len:324 (+) Transcript_29852:476-1447(+)